MEPGLAFIFGEKVTAMNEEIVLLSIPKRDLETLIIDCVTAVMELHQPAAPSTPESTVFDIDAFCEYSGLSKDTVYRKTGKGQIPHSKRGKRLYFDKSEVDAWLMANKVTPQGIAQRAEAYNKKRAKRQASAL